MRILIAEDTRLARLKLRHELERMGHEVVEASDGREAWELFQADPFPIVVTDWEMPNMNGVQLVERIRASDCDSYVYIVMLTGKSDKKDVVAGIEAGADDFVSKPFDVNELRARLSAGQRIVELEQHLAHANDQLKHELAVARELSDAEHRRHEATLLGESIPVRALRSGIERYAGSDDPLLLTGPQGAGHEAVARAIHLGSARHGRPFIYVACPHLRRATDSIFGSPGSQRSAGGAAKDLPQLGKAHLAHGGTLYLEGIETLGKETQQELMTFLKDAAEQRARGEKPDPDVRIIAYLNESHERLFDVQPELTNLIGRERLVVPSLAERRDDIKSIAASLLHRRAASVGKVVDRFSDEAEQMLQSYSWPGNLRELRGVVDRAILLSPGNQVEIPRELLREGRRVGGYTLARRLGKGGMGEVWLARHSLLARPAAVKLIRQEALQGDAEAREMLKMRFQREAKATAQLRSPHTVELYDFGISEEGDFYYVMEFLRGVDLRFLVQRFGALDPARAVSLLTQACMSLHEAHQAGLVHRDIKPANLFVCQLGPHFDFLKLLDFGIVRATASLETTGSTGLIRGTPECISPEAAGGEPATFASDLYGLGCVAHWLLTGKRVFDASSAMAMIMQHVTKEPRSLQQYADHLPAELDELVLKCLAKDPGDRPASALELSEQLSALSIEPWSNATAKLWWEEHEPELEVEQATVPFGETVQTGSMGTTAPKKKSTHPSDADLRQWIDGSASIKQTAAIERHLEECDPCARRLGELQTDSGADEFVDRVREVMDTPSGSPTRAVNDTDDKRDA